MPLLKTGLDELLYSIIKVSRRIILSQYVIGHSITGSDNLRRIAIKAFTSICNTCDSVHDGNGKNPIYFILIRDRNFYFGWCSCYLVPSGLSV